MSTRPWFLAAGAAVVATAATIAAFAVLGDDAGTTSGTPAPADSTTRAAEPSEPESSSPAPQSESATPSTEAVPVYYVGQTGQGPRLYREFHQVPTTSVDDAVAQGLNEAVAGEPADPDYETFWPEGAKVARVEKSGDTLVVDLTGASKLHDRPAGMTEDQAQISVDQLVYTVQAGYQDKGPVRFLLDGQITDQLLGIPVSEPLARPDDMSSLAQVWIISPEQGDSVKSGFTVKGVGAFFEANVVWELRRGDNVVASSAKSGPVTAEECCTMAPYSFTVKAPPGDYTLVVSDEDASGGEGPAPFQDTKDITVR
jgi:Immunoglobulin-like domain of bacterial spore germination/Sporulation and spore germination